MPKRKMSNKQLIKIIKDDFQEPYKHEWEQIAECIVTDQVPASDIAKFFQNKAFYKFYKKNYMRSRWRHTNLQWREIM